MHNEFMPPKGKSKKKGKRAPYEGEEPAPPNPGDEGDKFLGWIRKRGQPIATFVECNDYCNSIGLDLKKFAREHIKIGRSSGGEIAVKIMDKKWAAKWARKYGYDLPHHRHEKNLKEIKL